MKHAAKILVGLLFIAGVFGFFLLMTYLADVVRQAGATETVFAGLGVLVLLVLAYLFGDLILGAG